MGNGFKPDCKANPKNPIAYRLSPIAEHDSAHSSFIVQPPAYFYLAD